MYLKLNKIDILLLYKVLFCNFCGFKCCECLWLLKVGVIDIFFCMCGIYLSEYGKREIFFFFLLLGYDFFIGDI